MGPLDEKLVEDVIASIGTQFKFILAEQAGGKMGLRVATIYDSSRLNLSKPVEALKILKSDEITQFGLVSHFSIGERSFTNVCVHLSGGHSEKDHGLRLE